MQRRRQPRPQELKVRRDSRVFLQLVAVCFAGHSALIFIRECHGKASFSTALVFCPSRPCCTSSDGPPPCRCENGVPCCACFLCSLHSLSRCHDLLSPFATRWTQKGPRCRLSDSLGPL